MSHPDIVQSALGDESVAARVTLGDDALFVTPTRTLVYRADSLLSDESVEEFPHGAERIGVSAGRRKATISLDYGLDGERSLTVPVKLLDQALHPVLAGTLNATGVTDPGETVKETFHFSELTLVITSDRLVKHVGNAVWDEEFEEFHYDDVTDLTFEDGNVATTVVVTHGDRQERFKAPSKRAREVRERLTQAVIDYHDVDSLATLRERFAVDEEDAPSATMSFGEGPTPLSITSGELAEESRDPTKEDESDGDEPGDAASADTGSGSETATATDADDGVTAGVETVDAPDGTATTEPPAATQDDDTGAAGIDRVETGDDLAALAAEIETLRESVDAQNERIARQEELIERLIGELRERL